jgi:hypothetical protein
LHETPEHPFNGFDLNLPWQSPGIGRAIVDAVEVNARANPPQVVSASDENNAMADSAAL